MRRKNSVARCFRGDGRVVLRVNRDANLSLKGVHHEQTITLVDRASGDPQGITYAQYPILDMVASKVIQKYQSSSCEQLWQQKGEPKSMEEQRVIGLLKNDAQMRIAFINQVAAPIANKMFECGMIP